MQRKIKLMLFNIYCNEKNHKNSSFEIKFCVCNFMKYNYPIGSSETHKVSTNILVYQTSLSSARNFFKFKIRQWPSF